MLFYYSTPHFSTTKIHKKSKEQLKMLVIKDKSEKWKDKSEK